MAEFKIDIDLSGLIQHQRVITAEVMPLLSQAVRAVAQQGAANWIEAVRRAKLWSGEKDAYAATIRYEMTGDFSAVIFSDYKHAEEIESGRPARDLKKMLDTSTKVRRTKDGKRFLVIPFRHNVQNMPAHVYEQAKALSPSLIIGQGKRRAGELTSSAFGIGMTPMSEKRQRRNPYLKSTATHQDVMVNRNIYSWGQRLMPGSMGPNAKGKVDRFAGMVRFDTSTPGANRSGYMTFRVMSESSNGWIVPPQPGLRLAENVANELRPLAERAFQEAVKRTVG